jgi:hypothetical protein
LYKEPEVEEDLLDDCNWLYRKSGKAIQQPKEPLPPHDDLIKLEDDKECYQKELDTNLDLSDCPEQFHTLLTDLVVKYWDCFTEDGLALPIRGFEFVVNTGNSARIACKAP